MDEAQRIACLPRAVIPTTSELIELTLLFFVDEFSFSSSASKKPNSCRGGYRPLPTVRRLDRDSRTWEVLNSSQMSRNVSPRRM